MLESVKSGHPCITKQSHLVIASFFRKKQQHICAVLLSIIYSEYLNIDLLVGYKYVLIH